MAAHRDPRLGILFIVLSCVVQGTQYVFEEKVHPPLTSQHVTGHYVTPP